jgi:hypothetical protein
MDTKDRTIFVAALVIAGIGGRLLLTGLPNFAPVGALALFAGASFSNKRLAFTVPLVVMLLTDWAIGFHPTMLYVYAATAVYVLLGQLAGNQLRPLRLVSASLAGSVAFFLITNFGHFMAFYPMTLSGLVECYTLAIPFFDKTLLSDLAFGSILFGSLAIAQQFWPRLRPAPATIRIR